MINKDIRNLISEAFDELYKEIISEAPTTIRKTKIDDSEVNSLIQKGITRGTPIPNAFASEDIKSRDNFDKIIDALANDYKTTKNPKSKAAIQGSFYPERDTNGHPMKIMRSIAAKFIGNKDIEDATASAYEQVVINNFDKILDIYKVGTLGLGGLFTSDMKNKVYNYIVGGHREAGSGGGWTDAIGGKEKSFSLDDPIGDAGEMTRGDKLASSLAIGPGTALEKGFAKEKETATKREILDNAISLLSNTFKESGSEIGKRRMIALKGIIDGDTPEDIFEDNPGLFKEPRIITQEFERIINSSEAKEVSNMISNIYGIKFNFSNIDPKKLKQTSSMNPNFGGFSKWVKIATPEMQEAQKNLNNALSVVGLKSTDFNSTNKKEQTINKLKSDGMYSELEAILDADQILDDVTKKAKNRGEFDVKTPLLPSSDSEEKEVDKMFEIYKGVNIDKLIDRVYKRISNIS